MDVRSDRARRVATACSVAAAVLLVVGITRPPARTGIASTISMHELFDLLLAGNLPLRVPRWIGLFGYLPALGGALLLLAEATRGPRRVVVRSVGLAVVVVSVIGIVWFGPWGALGNLGAGSWIVLAGMGCALLGAGVESVEAVRVVAKRIVRRNGDEHVLSPVRE
jgi:hypothetical protein